MKLITLFILTCPERISALATLDLRHCSVHQEERRLTFSTPSLKAGKPAEAFFVRFEHSKNLLYMSSRMISVISQGNHKYSFCHFVLSTGQIAPLLIRPHKSVTSTTLGHWLRTFMKAAGIDSQIFKAHSVRGASMTAAAFLPFSTIVAVADWSSRSTFRTFYYKLLFNSDFAMGVLLSK